MYISEELRKNNISEYLLYMWQVEDALRAAGLDADRLYRSVAEKGGAGTDNAAWRGWYQDLADMMRREGKQDSGHLQVNENVLELLWDLHKRLLENRDKVPQYHEAYYRALPFIVEFRAHGDGGGKNELENCFDMLYGVWMLKLGQKTVTEATAQAVAKVSQLVGMLAAYYHKEKAGQLDLE